MKQAFIFLLILTTFTPWINAAVTIEECVAKAETNYPLIKKYGLLSGTTEINLADINKSWLPRISVYGQATIQNDVPSFPKTLSNVLEQMGQNMRGLGKFQYKIGTEISQKIWDGGESRSLRELARSREEAERASVNVELYSVRQRVENLYFAILLTEKQIEENRLTYKLLLCSLEKLRAMYENGTAMQSDVDMMEAQALVLNQCISEASQAAKGYRQALSLFMGEDVGDTEIERPTGKVPEKFDSDRPELELFSSRLAVTEMSEKLTNTSLLPKIGAFAQAYYGYPGFDYFSNMMNRKLSFNVLAGFKASWNIDSFYTRKNAAAKNALQAEDIKTERDVFIFNTNLQVSMQNETIEGLRTAMQDDARIVALRTKIRKAAEVQLDNGVIDITSFLSKITDENIAMLNAQFHEIQLLQEIYKLKYILNR